MALALYEVDLGGGRTARLRLNEADAAAYGGRARPVDDATEPTPPPATQPDAVDAKQRIPQNKARTPSDK